MRDPNSLSSRLLLISIGSCTCLTKTDDIRFHKLECKYRIIMEAYDIVSELENKSSGSGR